APPCPHDPLLREQLAGEAAREGGVRPDHRAAPCALLGSPERAERRDGNHTGEQGASLGQAGRGAVRSCRHRHRAEGRRGQVEPDRDRGRCELAPAAVFPPSQPPPPGNYGCIEPMIFSSETRSVIMPCLTAAAYHVRYQRAASSTSGPASAP